MGPVLRRSADPAHPGGAAQDVRVDHAGSGDDLSRVRHARALSARTLVPPGVRPGAPGRPDVHDAGGDLRHAHRRFGHLHHPLHDLRGHSPVLQRREVLHRLLVQGVRGAAAFLIAEFLKITYLDVILMATIPTLLYYLSLFVMVEMDARKFGMRNVETQDSSGLWPLTRRYGFHFTSLVAIVVFMLMGYTAIMAVFWATVIAIALSFLRKECALYPGRLVEALNAGSVGVLGVAVTCAAAGLIVGVVTLTGLGLKFSSIIINYAGNSVLLTAIYSGLIVWIIGLAVPITASYIICAVIVAPALTQLGVPDFAAHMFIFTFVLDPTGVGILLKGPWTAVIWTSVTAAIGIVSLAGGVQGWLFKKTVLAERVLLVAAGLFLVYPKPMFDAVGIGLVAVVGAMQLGFLPRLRLRIPLPGG